MGAAMALAPDDRLGPYRIETLLGAGGMGEVYRGIDTRLGRAVALKVISGALVEDEASRRRFEVEARAASALNHPAIVTIYDIGESGGVSWIAMELVEGRTLSDVVAQGSLPIRHAWSVARQLADGLAVAHAKGIVHRDLKPANVMLSDDGRVKILDFGLARQTAAIPSQASADTVTAEGTIAGSILGTVGYMSPEQATSRAADFRADQFSLGALVYELVTGQRAFAGATAIETLSAIIRDEPAPPSSIRRGISDAFERVISRCLEKNPAQRFETTRELATALDALTPESSTSDTTRETAIDQAHPIARARARSPRTWGIAAAVVVLALVAAALLWNRRDGAALPAIDSVAVLPFENTAQDPDIDYISAGLTDGLIDHLSRAESLKVMARATVMRFKGQRDPQEAARSLGVRAVVTGTLSRRGDQIQVAAELIDGATGERLWGQSFDRPIADLMRMQDSIVLSIAEGLRLPLSGGEREQLAGFGTTNTEAYELFLKGRFLMQNESEEGDLEALNLFTQAAAKDPNFVDAHLAISSVHARRAGSGYESPREAAVRQDAALAKAAAIDPHNVAVRVAMVHRRFVDTHDWATTEREYRAVMHDPAVLRTVQYHPISLFFIAIGRPDDAVALVERALVVDPGNTESRVMLGNFLIQAGRLDDALRVYNGIAAEAPGDPRPLFGAADVYKRRGDYARAGESRRRAYELAGDAEAARAFAAATTEAAYAKADITVAKVELKYLQELAKDRYVPPFDLARLHALIGNREQALTGLEQEIDGGSVGLMLLKADQAWDSVRADPRFAAIVRRVGIP